MRHIPSVCLRDPAHACKPSPWRPGLFWVTVEGRSPFPWEAEGTIPPSTRPDIFGLRINRMDVLSENETSTDAFRYHFVNYRQIPFYRYFKTACAPAGKNYIAFIS